MNHGDRRSTRRRGTASVELALVLPLVVGVLIGVWEMGRMVEAQQVLSNAAREGARQGSTGQRSVDEIKAAVTKYLQANQFDTTGIDIAVTNMTSSMRPDPRTANKLDRFRVLIHFPFNNVRWVLLGRNSNPDLPIPDMDPNLKLISSADWLSMRDEELEVTNDLPIE
jgi:Flp pilus assembly protein TadG